MKGMPASAPARPVAPAQLDPAPTVRRLLALARKHLDLDVALLAAFTEAGEMVGIVEGDGESSVRSEAELPVDRRRCQLLMEGSIPWVVGDVGRQRPGTAPGPAVAAYVAAPLQLPEGTAFGLLCCLARDPRPSLDGSAQRVLSVLAEMAGRAITDADPGLPKRLDTAEATLAAIGGDMRIVFQPVFRLRTGDVVGFEALARFPSDPRRPPRSWFLGARQVGLGVDLELAALRGALSALDDIPEPLYLSVNLFSETMLSDGLADLFGDVPSGRVVLELAEHERMADSRPLAESISRLRELGARFAVDHAGSGFSSLRHVLRLNPEILKLDMNLTHQVDTDPMQRMLVSSLASFAAEAGMVPAAEGIETLPQLDTLRRLGVVYGQGHYLGRPGPEPRIPGVQPGLPWAPLEGTG
jgi:EAL domain-containing protein (putative c-di-GMP-specific phosphodiesterase class I)